VIAPLASTRGQAVKRQVRRGHGDNLPTGQDTPARQIDQEFGGVERPTSRLHGGAEARLALEQPSWQAFAQAHEGDLGQGDFRLATVEGKLYPIEAVDDPLGAGWVVELGVRLEGRGYQDMGEPILGASEE